MFEENLADRIRDYWAKRGYQVRVLVRSVNSAPTSVHDNRFYQAARSDLVNGLPNEGSEIPGVVVEKPNPLALPLR